MSWLSQLAEKVGIGGAKNTGPQLTDFGRELTKGIGSVVIKAIPGGAGVEEAWKGKSLEQIAQETADNIRRSVNAVSTASNVQSQGQQILAAATSPLGLVALGGAIYFAIRKKGG